MIQVTGKAITRRALMPGMYTRTRRDARSVEIQITLKISSVQQRNFNASLVISMDTSQASVIKETSFIQAKETKGPYVTSRCCVCLWQIHLLPLRRLFIQWWVFLSASKDPVIAIWSKKIPTPSHLITSLAYKLKPHQTRNQYLKARLHTCTDVNIMPASVYKLVFNDPEVKMFAPHNLEIDTFTTNTVKIVGSCLFYFVSPRH